MLISPYKPVTHLKKLSRCGSLAGSNAAWNASNTEIDHCDFRLLEVIHLENRSIYKVKKKRSNKNKIENVGRKYPNFHNLSLLFRALKHQKNPEYKLCTNS